jgi:outer membrane protein
MKHLLLAVFAAAILPAWGAASAQDSNDLRIRVGAGAQLHPRFLGSDETKLVPLFHINTARGTSPFKFGAPDDSFGIGLISSGGFSIGPAAKLRGSRKDSEVGAPVGKVPTTFEAGAFAQYEIGDSYRLRAEVLKGIGGHDGLEGSIGADRIWRDGDRYVFSVGPRLMFSDARFQRAYFGITPEASLASGLPAYRPGGGIHAVAVASGMSYQLDNRWGLFGFARYSRLVGDAAKSPIVRDIGSRNQLSGGIGLNYTFTMRRP